MSRSHVSTGTCTEGRQSSEAAGARVWVVAPVRDGTSSETSLRKGASIKNRGTMMLVMPLGGGVLD